MPIDPLSRRSFVKLSTAGALAAAAAPIAAQEAGANPLATQHGKLKYQEDTRAQRLAWWQHARFGMFIHWGLYSIIGQQEWVLESEGIPIPQYEILAKHFKPKSGFAREWARLAKRAGQKYMVLTAKHHEGFCNWDTKLTNYNSMQQGPGIDIVREFVEAARKRFVAYTHGLIREILTNYGKIDILWYDVDKPLTAEQWEADRGAQNRPRSGHTGFKCGLCSTDRGLCSDELRHH